MNGLTILLWVTIFIIGLIAVIAVKLHYKGVELEKEEKSGYSEKLSSLIESFLNADKVNKKTDDDKTLFLASTSDDLETKWMK